MKLLWPLAGGRAGAGAAPAAAPPLPQLPLLLPLLIPLADHILLALRVLQELGDADVHEIV